MKHLILLACLLLSLPVQAAQPSNVRFELDAVPVSQVLRVLYAEVIKTDYVLDPAILADARAVSFRFDNAKGDIKPFLLKFLDQLGYQIDTVGGTDFVKQKQESAKETEKTVFVYHVLHRDGSYLVDLLAPLFKGNFTAKRMVQAPPDGKSPAVAAPPNSALAQIDRVADVLVFSGTAKEIEGLKKILQQVDISAGQVTVRGVVYEVQTGSNDGTAFSLAGSILGGKLGVSLGSTTPLDSAITIKAGGLQAVISALSNDSRFKVRSSPSLRVRSGQQGKIVVGDDVPVLGSLSYPQGSGQAVQSVAYQSSGVIFQITPQVRETEMDIDITQQMSSFVQTTTGVNASPTLSKREIDTSITVSDGDVIVLGGLDQDDATTTQSGLSFLPAFMHSKTESKTKTEILLVLQVTKI